MVFRRTPLFRVERIKYDYLAARVGGWEPPLGILLSGGLWNSPNLRRDHWIATKGVQIDLSNKCIYLNI